MKTQTAAKVAMENINHPDRPVRVTFAIAARGQSRDVRSIR